VSHSVGHGASDRDAVSPDRDVLPRSALTSEVMLGVTSGVLYVVGTPIGNLEDMTWRAVRVLQTVDFIAAEDTRHTGKLLQHFQITTPQVSYHHHNRTKQTPKLLARLAAGQSIAIVTDAGMPGISDPGRDLVAACAEVGVSVVPIPGVSASVTAVSVSGLDCDRFIFEGFLPTKRKLRQQALAQIAHERRAVVFYEAPHRVQQTLADLLAHCGDDRPVMVGRELTKRYEELWRGTLAAAVRLYDDRQPQGEYTIVLAGASEIPALDLSDSELQAELRSLLAQGVSRSQACRQLAEQVGRSRRELYQLAITIDDVDVNVNVDNDVEGENDSFNNDSY